MLNRSRKMNATVLVRVPRNLRRSINNRSQVRLHHVELLKPCHNELIYAYAVSTRVNSPQNNDEELVKVVERTT